MGITLRARVFLVVFMIVLMFVGAFLLQWRIQESKDRAMENRVQQLMLDAISGVFSEAEHNMNVVVGMLASHYQREGVEIADEELQNGFLLGVGRKHGMDFQFVMEPDGYVAGRYLTPMSVDEKSQFPIVDFEKMIFSQIGGLTEKSFGVAYWQQKTLFFSVDKWIADDRTYRYFVAGYFIDTLFNQLKNTYSFDAMLLDQVLPVKTKSTQVTYQLPGLVAAPVYVRVDDNGFEHYKYNTLGLLVVGLAVVFSVVIWLVFRSVLFKRIDLFLSQARGISVKQDYSQRIDLGVNDELSELAGYYNTVLSSLEYSYNLMAKSNLITTELISRVGESKGSESSLNVEGIESDSESDLRSSLDMVARLSDAIQRETIEVYYQPVIDNETAELKGVEALCRWLDQDLGMIPPAGFVSLAEKSGQMGQLGSLVAKQVCRDIKRWIDAVDDNIYVSFNLTVSQFLDDQLLTWLQEMLQSARIEARFVEVEIKEYALTQNIDQATDIIMALKTLGVRVCIDDFGLNRLSLMYLQRLPVNAIKLSKAFADRIENNPKEAAFIEGITRFAEGLGIRVTAKGVETELQKYALGAVHGLLYQGNIIAHPMPFEQLLEWRAEQ